MARETISTPGHPRRSGRIRRRWWCRRPSWCSARGRSRSTRRRGEIVGAGDVGVQTERVLEEPGGGAGGGRRVVRVSREDDDLPRRPAGLRHRERGLRSFLRREPRRRGRRFRPPVCPRAPWSRSSDRDRRLSGRRHLGQRDLGEGGLPVGEAAPGAGGGGGGAAGGEAALGQAVLDPGPLGRGGAQLDPPLDARRAAGPAGRRSRSMGSKGGAIERGVALGDEGRDARAPRWGATRGQLEREAAQLVDVVHRSRRAGPSIM